MSNTSHADHLNFLKYQLALINNASPEKVQFAVEHNQERINKLLLKLLVIDHFANTNKPNNNNTTTNLLPLLTQEFNEKDEETVKSKLSEEEKRAASYGITPCSILNFHVLVFCFLNILAQKQIFFVLCFFCSVLWNMFFWIKLKKQCQN